MLRQLACVLALVPVFWTFTAQALGLGEIDVRSKLNQRFAANIPVVSASTAEVESLTVRLASADDFARAGIERPDYLGSLEFSLAPNGTAVRVTSKQSARDPFLNFIVEARWNGGRLLREYTVLLDPPVEPGTEAPAPVSTPLPAPSPVVPKTVNSASPAAVKPAPVAPVKPAPAAKAPAAEPASSPAAVEAAPTKSYGPVHASETLWSIAAKLRTDPAVSMDQMLLALYKGNPQSFEGGFNGLLKGSRLKVPTTAEALAVDAATAKQQVDALRAGGKLEAAKPEPVKPAPTPVAPPAPKPVETKPTEAKPVAPAPVPPPVTPPAAKASETKPAEAKPVETAPAPAAVAPATPPATAPSAEPAAPAVSPATAAAPEVTPAAPVASAEPAKKPETPPASAAAGDDNPLAEYQLPLLGGLLAVIVGVFLLIRVRRARAEEAAARTAPSMMGSVAPMLEPVGELPPSLRGRSTSEPTKDEAEDSAADHESEPTTEASPEPAMPELAAASAETPAFSEHVDFDQAVRAEAQNVAVSLDSSDPLTEADFHLAYGLYDEAAQMLKAAAERDPDRVELRTKLAETYFAAGKALEFQETAEGLKGQVGRGEWEKVCGMGRQLCPDSALFEDSGWVSARNIADTSLPPSEPVAPSMSATELNIIDFDLDTELSSGTFASPTVTPAAPAAEAASTGATIDLSSFDLDGASSPHDDPMGKVDFNLDELDLAKFDEPEAVVTLGDEIDTKLDLARAYADMGDNDAARSLLTEVIEGGNPQQKTEAETLRERLAV